jgi:hypothetical protein
MHFFLSINNDSEVPLNSISHSVGPIGPTLFDGQISQKTFQEKFGKIPIRA